jgi:hypothetical protein
MSFDIIIPLGPNEMSNFNEQLIYTKKNVIGYRNIYIVTSNVNLKCDDCIVIDENVFPFKDFISKYFAQYKGKSNRNGWYFQQLIKLYAGVFISDLLENYLIIDADVFFLKPTRFIENNQFLFATGDEEHRPYFEHMSLLDSTFKKYYNKSGICHHMLFNKKYLNEIFNIVEKTHNKPFWVAFIILVNEHLKHNVNCAESGASEYEMYFNYIYNNHKDNIIIRDLKWQNISKHNFKENNYNNDNDFVSVCAWMG